MGHNETKTIEERFSRVPRAPFCRSASSSPMRRQIRQVFVSRVMPLHFRHVGQGSSLQMPQQLMYRSARRAQLPPDDPSPPRDRVDVAAVQRGPVIFRHTQRVKRSTNASYSATRPSAMLKLPRQKSALSMSIPNPSANGAASFIPVSDKSAS